jgi:hypothetical protein
MKRFSISASTLLFIGFCAGAPVFAASVVSNDELIAQAVTPLPDDLRAGATVLTYDSATGARKVLRQGTNGIECQPENPKDFFTRCYSVLIAPRYDFQEKLRAEKKTDKEIQAATEAAYKSGALKVPPTGTMSYRLSTKDNVIKKLWIVSVPYAKHETLGVSTVSQRDGALKGQGLPWMMLEGTSGAHIMIPIN